MRFNDKGQAFDVFKLLIAAVIAIAMLAILLPILKIVIPFTNEPSSEAAKLVKEYSKDRSSEYGESMEVTFSTRKELNAKSISEQSGSAVNPGLICLSKGDFQADSDFVLDKTGGNMILTYNGGSQKAKIGVLCDDGASIAQDLADKALLGTVIKNAIFAPGYTLPNEVTFNPDNTEETCGISSTAQKYCVLMLRYA